MRLEVTHIVETDSDKLHRIVAAVGGTTEDGSLWMVSMADAVDGVEQGRWSFFVRGRFGATIELEVAVAADGTQYLKGEKDADGPLTLLLLPRCKPSELRLPTLEKRSA